MAALLVERSFIDLRSQVTVNGVCNITSSDIKVLMSDHFRAKVWAASSLSFSLWYLHFRHPPHIDKWHQLKILNSILRLAQLASISQVNCENDFIIHFSCN